MHCPNCGNEIPEGTRFCGHCGHRLEPGPATEPFDDDAPTRLYTKGPVASARPPEIEPEPPAPAPTPPPAPPPKRARPRWAWGLVGVLGLIAVAAVVGIALLVTSTVALPGQQGVAPTPTSRPTPGPTSTPRPTSTPHPTATPLSIEFPEPVLEVVSDPTATFHDDFDRLSSSDWGNGSETVAVSNGTVEITGKARMSSRLYRLSTIEQGGTLLLLKHDPDTAYEIQLDYGEWQQPEYRRWGIYSLRQSLETNIWQGESDLGRDRLVGDFTFEPDKWYYLLLAVNRDATFVLRMWERDDPSKLSEYRRSFGQEWVDRSWTFHIGVDSGGKVYVDSFTEISFSDFEPMSPAEAHFWAGQTYYHQMDLEAALAEYDRAIELDPEQPIYYAQRGLCNLSLGDRDAAIADWLYAVELDPGYWQGHSNLASIYTASGDYEKALLHANRVIELTPDLSRGYRLRADAHRYIGNDPQAAIADYSVVIGMEPDEADHYRQRCIVYNSIGNHTAALQDCAQCIELNPEHDGCYWDRGWAYDGLGDTSAAVADFEMYLELVAPDVCLDCQETARAYVDEHGQ